MIECVPTVAKGVHDLSGESLFNSSKLISCQLLLCLGEVLEAHLINSW